METMTQDEWLDEGRRRFGKDVKQWKFVCPGCKTIQTFQDLIDVSGLNANDAQKYLASSCIGRFGEHKKGCDWTLGGLLRIHALEVVLDDGYHRPTFEFADSNVTN